MPDIDASLFAHIENDAYMTGTYGLAGNLFTNTTQYLKQFLDHLKTSGEDFPAEYTKILDDTDYLVEIEKQRRDIASASDPEQQLNTLSQKIADAILKLPIGSQISLPGGWSTTKGGHAMIYEFIRTAEGYRFNVINAGAGIQYHAKKSSREKELYNPVKPWSFPIPTTSEAKNELHLFIKRLIKIKLPPALQKRAASDKVLYEKVLPTISYIKGSEIEADTIPAYGYTAGQLGPSCAERCIHQKLKINSPSAASYERFIFNYKLYALEDYTTACLNGKQPFTLAVQDQINVAIENNFKILNTPGLFNKDETDKYYDKLKSIQKSINAAQLKPKESQPAAQQPPQTLTLEDGSHPASRSSHSQPNSTNEPFFKIELDKQNLLDNLDKTIQKIEQVKNPATQYYYLEQLILALPINASSNGLTNDFYSNIVTPHVRQIQEIPHFVRDFVRVPEEIRHQQLKQPYSDFAKHIDTIQNLLLKLQREWLQGIQSPNVSLLVLSVISLQIDTQLELSRQQRLPSFMPFAEVMMESVIGNCERNPLWATNNPIHDQRFKALQDRFMTAAPQYDFVYFQYFQSLLNTESQLNAELKRQYYTQYGFGTWSTDYHNAVRNKGLESLSLITLHLQGILTTKLDAKFNPLIDKVKAHIDYESKLRRAINPFYVQQLLDTCPLYLDFIHKEFRIGSPLFPTFVHMQDLSKEMAKHKYALPNSPARDALEADISKNTKYMGMIQVRTSNSIQLNPIKTEDKETNSPITQADIAARDYLHLRTVPSLQIALTLDYFTRHVAKLANEADQRYVEANLFQPGLLKQALKNPSFLPQFNRFLTTGLRFFSKNGQHTRESLLFLRLDYLVSQYLYCIDKPAGLLRLQALQEQLLKQVSQPNEPNVTYVQQQYLFLTLMARIELKDDPGELFALAFAAYFYIQSHANPSILEDSTHRIEVDKAFAKFQLLASQQPEERIKQAVERCLANSPSTKATQPLEVNIRKELRTTNPSPALRAPSPRSRGEGENEGSSLEATQPLEVNIRKELRTTNPSPALRAPSPRSRGEGENEGSSLEDLKLESGSFPVYRLTKGTDVVEMNVLLGKFFEKGLARSGVSFSLQNHPLMKHLNLHQAQACLATADNEFMILPTEGVRLFGSKDRIVVQKDWTVQGQTQSYELRGLTKDHLAHRAKYNGTTPLSLQTTLPMVLTDGTIDYWQNTSSPKEGLLVQHNRPLYRHKAGRFMALDKDSKVTPYQLTPLNPRWSAFLNSFESNDFILAEESPSDTVFKLPRYNLSFCLKSVQQEPSLSLKETDEQVIECPSPIHPAVAGLVLKNERQTRYLVPVSRFYATEKGAQKSDYYPVVHDTQGTIANACLAHEWKRRPPLEKPLWNYQNSEKSVSFRLKDGEPIADTVADALYLAYMYLATNQTEKAWKILHDCNTRLGGLTGDPAELQFIAWICQDLPHVLPDKKEDSKATRKTPPYIACQLKAMNLLGDYLLQDRKFNLKPPQADNTANYHYASLQHRQLKQFLDTLPSTIYASFTRLQAMRRHLDHRFILSTTERKNLLNYYHQSQPKGAAPLGALGYEWMCLSLESLQQERESLLARSKTGTSTQADQQRLALINDKLKELKPVLAKSTILATIPIDLSLPAKVELIQDSAKAVTTGESWQNKLPWKFEGFQESVLQKAIDALSSNIGENEFTTYFPAYFQIACYDQGPKRQQLADFCSQTLIANRHQPLDKQDSDIPLLCNVLYRVLHNKATVLSVLSWQKLNFAGLVSLVRSYLVPPLTVYQAKDVYQDILARPEDILGQERPARKPLVVQTTANPESTQDNPAKQQDHSILAQTKIDDDLTQSNPKAKEQLGQLVLNYRTLEKQTTAEITALGQSLTDNLEQRFTVEIDAGKKLFALEKEQKALAQQFITEPDFAKAILEAARKISAPLALQRDETWTKALNFAKQGPESPDQAKTWKIQKRSKARAKLSKADLLSMYCSGDVAYSVEKTGLSPEKAQELHELTHHALCQGIQHQIAEKIISNLEKSLQKNDVNLALQALELLAKEEIPGLDTPSTVIIQHEDDILLRNRQASAFKTHKESQQVDRVEKIIPGGGKSKVILPVLAEEAAQGDNLVVIEVPEALLTTNHIDFNRISQRLFGKRAYRFEFNRDCDCSPERLEHMYHHFTDVMTSRGYLVSTRESTRSLELKYVEFLESDDIKHDEVWEKQVFWLDKITGLFRHHTKAFIDEVHEALGLKYRLNYTLGTPKSIDPTLICNAVALFNFIDVDFIKQAPSFDNNYNWTPFKTNLAKKLIHDDQSPLKEFVTKAAKQYGQGIDVILMDYLLDKGEMSEAITQASPEDQASLAFFKEQIATFLPDTLHRKLDFQYGASRLKGLSPIEYTLAIPYGGNNSPNERNRFDVIESINCTIQMMLIKGVSKELLKTQVMQWQALARQELFQNPNLKTLDETPTAQGFALLDAGSGLTLSQLDVNNTDQMTDLHTRHKTNRSLIASLLQEQTLKQIHHDKCILSSDSFNHVDIYRSVVCVSGTPNDTTLHQRLSYDPTTSLGTDGYILEVLEDKKTPISSRDYQTVSQFIEEVINNSTARERTRVLEDVDATFAGVTNSQVAKELATYIKKNPTHFSNPLKHVLYFNEQQVLSALDLNKPDEPIELGTSDDKTINLILGSTPEERFSYYDQPHTLGADLKQADFAHAIVLINENRSFENYIQGKWRMRGLNQGQTTELITPQRLNGVTRCDLTKRLVLNKHNVLLVDNIFAAKGRMANLMRRTCLSRIQDMPWEHPAPLEQTSEKNSEPPNPLPPFGHPLPVSVEREKMRGVLWKQAKAKSELARQFKAFFVETSSLDLAALYGPINQGQDVPLLLDHTKKHLLALWTECHKAANIPLTEQELEKIGLALQGIIDKAIPLCLAKYKGPSNPLAHGMQIQRQIQKQIQIERINLNACYNSKLQESSYAHWNYNTVTNFLQGKEVKKSLSISLDAMCSGHEKLTSPLFSSALRASKNYVYVYSGQREGLHAFLKPVFLVWYHFEGEALQATIVTPQEAAEIEPHIKGSTNSWIATTLDTVTAGNPPPNILANQQYQSLREQVRFFNGEFEPLLNQDTPLIWLKEKSVDKIAFFENQLQIYRPGSETELVQLKAALALGTAEGFDYISQHPFEDLTQFDWKNLFPKTIPVQAAEYRKLASTFVYLNQDWLEKDLLATDIQQQFTLPFSSLSIIDTHLKHLASIKGLLYRLSDSSRQPFSPEEKACFATCIGQPFNTFYSHIGTQTVEQTKPFDDQNQQSWLLANIEALKLMQNYPALKGKSIIKYFERVATETSSYRVLHELLNVDKPSDNLLCNILYNRLSGPKIAEILLDSNATLSEQVLMLLTRHCTTKELVNKLLSKKESGDLVCDELIVKDCVGSKLYDLLDEEQLWVILSRVKKSETFAKLCRHSVAIASSRIQAAIVQHPLLDSELLLSLLDEKIVSENTFLNILEKRPEIDEQALNFIATKATSSSILVAVLSHQNVGNNVVNVIMQHPLFSVDLAKLMVNMSKGESRKKILRLSDLPSRIFEQFQKTQNADWENVLFQAFDSYPDQVSVVKGHQVTPEFGLKLLRRCDKQQVVSGNLPITKMIEIADETDLPLLIGIENISVYDKDALLLLVQKCQSNDSVNKLLNRTDLSTKELQALLSKDFLDAWQLLQLAGEDRDSKTLDLIFNHPARNDDVAKALCKHPKLSAELLLSILAKAGLRGHELLEIVYNPVVNSQILTAIANKEVNDVILCAVATHVKADSAAICAVTNNKAFTPAVAQQIIREISHNLKGAPIAPEKHILFKILLHKLIERNQKTQSAEWEDAIVQVLKQYQQQSPALKKAVQSIVTHQITPTLALKILPLFDNQVTGIPILEMIASAKDLSQLIAAGKAGQLSEPMLQLLAKKCQSKEEVGGFLEIEKLSADTLQIILNNDFLDENQLVTIAMFKAKEAKTLTLIYNHRAKDTLVINCLLRNPAFSSELLQSILAKENFSDSELNKILNHSAVNSAALTTLAMKEGTSSNILSAIARHSFASCSVLNAVIDNKAFTPAITQDIIRTIIALCLVSDTNTITLEHHTLYKKLLRKLIDRYQTTQTQRAECANAIEQVLKAYQNSTPAYKKEAHGIVTQQISPTLGLIVLPLFNYEVADLPIKGMIELANNEEDLFHLIVAGKAGKLTEPMLQLLAAKCQSIKTVNEFLSIQTLSADTLQIILKKVFLNEAQLLHLQLIAADSRNLLSVVSHSNVTPLVISAVIGHKACSNDVAQKITERLPGGNQVKLEHHELLKNLVTTGLSQYPNHPEWEDTIVQALKKYPSKTIYYHDMLSIVRKNRLKPTLALKVLPLLGDDILSSLPIDAMIPIADDAQLIQLTKTIPEKQCSPERFIAFANQCKSEATVGQLLARDDLPPEALLVVLDQIPDYENLRKALILPQLPKNEREDWLQNMETAVQAQVASVTSPDQPLPAALNVLKLKACTHAVQAIADPQYAKAAEASIELYRELRKEIHASNDPRKADQSLTNCEIAIRKATPVLESHRGYKQAFMDIINVILAIITLNTAQRKTGNWRIFNLKTDSIEIVDQIKASLDKKATAPTSSTTQSQSAFFSGSTRPTLTGDSLTQTGLEVS